MSQLRNRTLCNLNDDEYDRMVFLEYIEDLEI